MVTRSCLSPHTEILHPQRQSERGCSASMSYHHESGSSSSCYGVDGEVSDEPMLSSRPDALLANGGAFLPLPPSSYDMLPYYSQLPPLGLVPPPSSRLQAIVPALSSPTSSGGMATAASSFRRVLSTGDLLREEEQSRMVAAPARYSAEERRERIDKYRSKRNHRNFQKKITYACRKTLADSRPRVKGRFARNGGDRTEADDAHHAQAAEVAAAVPEWWPAMKEALALPAGTHLDNLCDATDDDDMLAAYLGVSSISLCSPSASGQ